MDELMKEALKKHKIVRYVSVFVDVMNTYKELLQENCAPKSSNQKQLLISFMESLTTEDITQIEIAEFDNVADRFLKQLEQ